MTTDDDDLPPLPQDPSPRSPHDDAPIAEQEPLGSGETSDSPSDLAPAGDRDPEATDDLGDRPLDVAVSDVDRREVPRPDRSTRTIDDAVDDRDATLDDDTAVGEDEVDAVADARADAALDADIGDAAAGAEDDLDEDEDPELGFIDDVRAESTPGTDEGDDPPR
jgi:hypothetical protein